MTHAFDGRLDEPVEVIRPITSYLVEVERRASRIMELAEEGSEVYMEANEIESTAGYLNLILAGNEI